MGLATYVSVPIVLAGHQLWGMVCGASRLPQPEVSDRVITVMEAFADIIAEHVGWERAAATQRRAEAAEAELRIVPGSGVGLGLHIVRGLVEASGGSVTATPNSVAGSTFTVRLPSRPSP